MTDKINPESDDIETIKKKLDQNKGKIQRNKQRAENAVRASNGKQKIIRIVLEK